MDVILDYVIEKRWEHKVSGDEIIIKECPFCHRDTWKFYLNRANRLYKCFRASCVANSGGHVSTLKKHCGDIIQIEGLDIEAPEPKDFTERVEEWYTALLEKENYIKYLDDHGITLTAINRFKLGIRKHKKNMWLVYPSWSNDKATYLKYRLLPFEKVPTAAEKEQGISKFWREEGTESILFNQDCIRNHDDIIVTEGEKDAITLITAGFDNVVGSTGGAETLRPSWYDLLKEKRKIYLVFDNDAAGKKGAKENWASRLGEGKCYIIYMPKGINDVTDFFLSGKTKQHFEKLLEEAEVISIPGVRTILSVLKDMVKVKEEEELLPTPWVSVNRLIHGGFRKGELITIAAPPGIGKTTLSLQISSHLSVDFKKPGLFFCQEMTYEQLVRLFITLTLRKPWVDFNPKDALLLSLEFEDVPLFFGYSPRITLERLQHTFLEAKDRFGISYFVFDNLHTLIRTDEKVTEKVGVASKVFKDLAMEMKVPIILVAQPRKLEGDRPMVYYDIRDSSSVPADSDIVILLHRNRTMPDEESGTRHATFESNTRFIVDKVREWSGGECMLLYNGDYRRFDE